MRRVEVCETMLSDYQDRMKFMITGDETWIYAYDPETTDQSIEYRTKGDTRPTRSRQSRLKIKVMLTVFFNYCGVVHYEFLPPGQTVNKEYYLNVMRRFCTTIMRRLTLHSFFVTITPKTQRISFHSHHIRLIWLRVTSGFSPNSKDHSEDTVLTRLKRYKPNRKRL